MQKYKTFKDYLQAEVSGTLDYPFEKTGSKEQDFYNYFIKFDRKRLKDSTCYYRLKEDAIRFLHRKGIGE